MSDMKCPLGDACDLTIAWMMGAERAKDTIKAQADEIERLRAAPAKARDDALEEAAKVIEDRHRFRIGNRNEPSESAKEDAAAIRAMIPKGSGE